MVLLDDGRMAERTGIHRMLTAPAAVLILIGFRWSWNGSTAHFERRASVGAEQTRRDVRAEMISEMSWTTVLGGAAFGLFLTVGRLIDWPPRNWDDRLWLALGLIVLATSAMSCFEKWGGARR